MGRGGMTSVLSHSLHLECQRLLSVLSHWRKLLICTDSCILLRFHVIVFSLKTIFHSFFWRYLTWTWSHSVAVFNQYRPFLCPLVSPRLTSCTRPHWPNTWSRWWSSLTRRNQSNKTMTMTTPSPSSRSATSQRPAYRRSLRYGTHVRFTDHSQCNGVQLL